MVCFEINFQLFIVKLHLTLIFIYRVYIKVVFPGTVTGVISTATIVSTTAGHHVGHIVNTAGQIANTVSNNPSVQNAYINAKSMATGGVDFLKSKAK